MFGIGTTELILILVIVLIFFGTGKLKSVMADLGGGMRSFKKAMLEEKDNATKDEPQVIASDPNKQDKT